LKILIENATIITMDRSRLVIDRGYIYINKGVIAAVGEGDPPPELEFAEYIIDGRGRIVMPAFTIGACDILTYTFRYMGRDVKEIISSLSKSDLVSLLEVSLMSLAMRGVGSILSFVEFSDFLDQVVKAVSETWIRVRFCLSEDAKTAIANVRNALKNVSDPEAVPKGIVSFSLRRINAVNREDRELADEFGSPIYVERPNQDTISQIPHDRLVLVNTPTLEGFRRVVVDDIRNLWRPGVGICTVNPKGFTPYYIMRLILEVAGSPIDAVAALTIWNASNIALGVGRISEGVVADIVMLNYREPPIGPIPMNTDSLFEAIAYGDYAVETLIVGGEIVIDRGQPLTVGDATYKKALATVQQIMSKR